MTGFSCSSTTRFRAWTHRSAQYGWRFGVGIAQGFATLGRVGFEGRYDYAAIGTVTNLSARLCSEAAAGQILVTQRVLTGSGDVAVSRAVGPLVLRGFSRAVEAHEILGLDAARVLS